MPSIILKPDQDSCRKPDKGMFLAGPIQGTSDWQSKAIEYIDGSTQDRTDMFFIASPRSNSYNRTVGFSQAEYESQVDWEQKYIETSFYCDNSTVLFWCANEEEHTCKRSYAQTTRFELGDLFGRVNEIDKNMNYNHANKVAIGLDSNYSGSKYIRYRASKLGIQVYDNLQSLCDHGIRNLK